MGKCSAQAVGQATAEGIRDWSRMAATRHEAWDAVRKARRRYAGMLHVLFKDIFMR